MKITLVCHKYGVPLNDPCCYPLGFMYVSALLKKQGHEVKVLNYNLWDDYDLRSEIKKQDLVMFTGFEEFKRRIVRDAIICEEVGIKTAVGGALATFCTEEMEKYVNFVYPGEFELNTRIENIPYPDYDGFEVERYFKRNGFKHIGVLTSRGCPYSCSFCSQTCSFRARTVQNVMKEVDFYKEKYGTDWIVFNDNTFNLNETRFLSFCYEMKQRRLAWGASIRCDNFTEEMLIAAKESNCQGFVVGVESFNQKKLDKMNKQLKVEDIYRTLDLLEKYKIDYKANILVGFEDESYQDIANEIASIPSSYKVTPMLVQPFIGTKNGKQRLINIQEEKYLSGIFKEYVETKGLYMYPELGGIQ